MNINRLSRFSLSTFLMYSITLPRLSFNNMAFVRPGSMKPTCSSGNSSFMNLWKCLQKKRNRTCDLNYVKFELKVLTSTIITNINSQHPDLNNWHSEPLLWCKQGRIIICIDVYGGY